MDLPHAVPRSPSPRRSDIAVAGVARTTSGERPRDRLHAVLAAAALLGAAPLASACVPSPSDPSSYREADDGDDDDASDTRESRRGRRAPGAPVPPGQQVWLDSADEAIARGREENRPVLVHFDSPYCADCKRLKQDTLGDPRVKEQVGRFVAVRIEATNDEDPRVSAALQKYTVINVPTLILLDSAGHEQRRITELVGPETLLLEIGHVR